MDTRTIIAEALEEAAADRKGELFPVEIPDHLPRLLGYSSHLVHLFTNLFSNSFKFMGDQRNPRITVSYERVTASGETTHRFSVSDNGMGIPEDYLADIFRPFFRVPAADEIEGTGVGLASVQRIVRSHGGTVSIDSRVGEGTTVTFTLPWKEIESSV